MENFRKTVYGYFARRGRDLPWRKTRDPYRIVVSEVMLQQTQVPRVVAKYTEFIRVFPTVRALAQAPLEDILRVWQGLGYNRRALLLRRLAQKVVSEYGGTIPSQRRILGTLPGIGKATSGSICAFAFNQPEVFIETNIRSVFIHHFFKDRQDISDKQLIPLVEKTLDRKHPCRWYGALMDYGAHLKETFCNPSRKSRQYNKQSKFQGSDRQMRGKILKILLVRNRVSETQLCVLLGIGRTRCKKIIASLCNDGLIERRGENVFLVK